MLFNNYATDNLYILYNQELLHMAPARLFRPESLPGLNACNSQGRTSTLHFAYGDLDLVLKQYKRGGLLSRVIDESYLFWRLRRTRMWREFHLLARMREMGLPVPTPVAASCERNSPVTYRGTLISQNIPDTQTLAQIICDRPLSRGGWRRIGQVIAQFHQHQVYHADLNANNILIDRRERVFLVDFDKGEIRPRLRLRWARGNLDRLLRSLHKLARHHREFYFSEADWAALEAGYRAETERPAGCRIAQ